MWGEKWGEMIWGGSPASAVQIPFGPWTLLFLGFILGVCAVYANRSRMARVVPFVMVLLVPVVSVIAVNLPFTFQNNTVADADEVNANFQELSTAIGALSNQDQSPPIILKAINPIGSVFFQQSALDGICADDDGCMMRLCGGVPVSGSIQRLLCVLKPFHQNGAKYTVVDLNTETTYQLVNNDGSMAPVIDFAGCAFSDGDDFSNNDNDSRMRLYRTFGSSRECVLRFDD